MTFTQIITLLLIGIGGAIDIINAIMKRPTVLMSFINRMIDLTTYLLKELKTRNWPQVMNGLWVIGFFLLFFFTLISFIFQLVLVRRQEFPATLLIVAIGSILSYGVAMVVCSKFIRFRYKN